MAQMVSFQIVFKIFWQLVFRSQAGLLGGRLNSERDARKWKPGQKFGVGEYSITVENERVEEAVEAFTDGGV